MFCIDIAGSPLAQINAETTYLLDLAEHFGDLLRTRYADEIEPPRYAAQRVEWAIDGDTLRTARRYAETARRLAILAGRTNAETDGDKLAQILAVVRGMRETAQQVDPLGTLCYGHGMLRDGDSDSRGHGVDNRTASVRASGKGERVRDNREREIRDNDMKQADYAAQGSVSYGDILALAERNGE